MLHLTDNTFLREMIHTGQPGKLSAASAPEEDRELGFGWLPLVLVTLVALGGLSILLFR